MENPDTQRSEFCLDLNRDHRYHRYHPVQHFKEGCVPDLGPRVLTLDDSEYSYSMVLNKDFSYKAAHIRTCIHVLLQDRWFARECDLPCALRVFEDGAKTFGLNFVFRHRVVSRFARNTILFSVPPEEWFRLKVEIAGAGKSHPGFAAKIFHFSDSVSPWRSR